MHNLTLLIGDNKMNNLKQQVEAAIQDFENFTFEMAAAMPGDDEINEAQLKILMTYITKWRSLVAEMAQEIKAAA